MTQIIVSVLVTALVSLVIGYRAVNRAEVRALRYGLDAVFDGRESLIGAPYYRTIADVEVAGWNDRQDVFQVVALAGFSGDLHLVLHERTNRTFKTRLELSNGGYKVGQRFWLRIDGPDQMTSFLLGPDERPRLEDAKVG